MSPDQLASDSVASKIVPRRAAAQKASKLAAEQLDSDEEDRGGPFREPSTPKSPVKVTYGGKRKYKRTPTNAHAGSSRAHSRSLSLVESSPNRPRATNVGRGRGGGRGRGASGQKHARTRSGSHISSIENESVGKSDPEVIIVEDELKLVVDIPRRNTATGSEDRGAHVNGDKAQASTGKGPKKRPMSHTSSSGSGDFSDLTPVSSPEVPSKPLQLPPTITLAPRLARQFLRVQSQMQPATVPEFQPQPLKQSKSLDDIFALDSESSESEDDMDATDVGSLVWVSLDLEGHLADATSKEDTMWWPAKVVLPKPLMRVSLFGDPPGPHQLDIPSPSASNVRSIELDGHIRFDENDYRPSRRKKVQSSPRKKRKFDLDIAWREARDAMISVYEGNDDEVAPGSSRYASGSSRRTNGTRGKGKAHADPKGKGKAKASDSDMDTGEGFGLGLDFGVDLDSKAERQWRAPSPNPLLEIPGELILARESRAKRQYWPAKILAYVRPTRPSQKPKYKVVFFDGIVKQIEPDLFCTTTDDEFATCNMGDSTGHYGLDADNDALEHAAAAAEDFTRPFAPEDEATLRAPSPLPALPAPGPIAFETELSVAEQFEYVKPVLAAVLDDAYGPAKARNEGFMRGGGARRKVLDAVPPRGSLTAMEKEEVAFLVRSWAWRMGKRREMGLQVEYPRDRLFPPPLPRAREERATGKLAAADGEGGDDDADSVLTPTSELSCDDTEPLPPSEPEAPPSSFAPTENDTDDEKVMSASGWQDVPDHELAAPVPENGTAVIVSPMAEHRSSTEDAPMPPSAQIQDTDPAAIVPVPEDGQEANDKRAAPVDDSVAAARPPSPPLLTARRTFHDLDAVEKITYCNNILLQEAILQLLLWRTGQRKVLGLLEPQEEERLHARATEEGDKTNWVHDILRLRQAVEKTMLPPAKPSSKRDGSVAVGTIRPGRTRRGV
ncbi:hypothetical protein BD311DRAFT_860098 [Dichomitus squalens]|uniref:PWWP domain-containing protein n=1 Tax=Dichomitus squalens TaxID=114155 RepID=A0A4Q9N4S3_9APHY|nr:hypothetical protein BD311DRAFT_860098 [Dichomitus squalens]